jgi:hypothetical protein
MQGGGARDRLIPAIASGFGFMVGAGCICSSARPLAGSLPSTFHVDAFAICTSAGWGPVGHRNGQVVTRMLPCSGVFPMHSRLRKGRSAPRLLVGAVSMCRSKTGQQIQQGHRSCKEHVHSIITLRTYTSVDILLFQNTLYMPKTMQE